MPEAARILNICRVEINPFLQNMSVNFTANNFKITVFSNATIGMHAVALAEFILETPDFIVCLMKLISVLLRFPTLFFSAILLI